MPVREAVPPAARDAILAWYRREGRDLAFRATRDPYAVLVSETMAQQTQIGRATEAWGRFVARFPSFDALAAARPADVLREWRGLGYNRRALNLWRTAGIVVSEHGGRLPEDLATLRSLPGIGPYTARAVAALAFDAPVAAVDTNVRRVIGRMVRGTWQLEAKDLQAIADASVPTEAPGEWTHALMDTGARFCRPRPRCDACPARAWCAFAAVPAAPATRPGRSRRPPAASFESTSRWLRGRILDRLRDAPEGEWVELDAGLGRHDHAAVLAALGGLADEGLAETDPENGRRARLPLA